VSAFVALSGFLGSEIGVRIARWSSGIDSTHWGVHRLSLHPTAAAIALTVGFGLVVTWWAGLGVDGSVRWLSEKAVLSLASASRRVQTGRLQEYLFATVIGIVAIIFAVTII
jgi:hypothetical protein